MVYRMDPCFHRLRHACEFECCSVLSDRLVSCLVLPHTLSRDSQLTTWAHLRGIIGPYLVSQGLALGEHRSSDPRWSDLMSYSSLSSDFANADRPSPRYWLLWPGVICMMATSLTGVSSLTQTR